MSVNKILASEKRDARIWCRNLFQITIFHTAYRQG